MDARDQRRRIKRVDAGVYRCGANVKVNRGAATELEQNVQKRQRVFPTREADENSITVLDHAPLRDRTTRHEHEMLV